MTTAETGATVTTDSVDFVDEDDARRVLLRLVEHVADAGSAHTDEHFDEVRTGNREERHVRLPGNRTGEQGLAGAWRTNHQHAFRNRTTQLLEFAGITEEIDDFPKLFLGLLDAGNVLEGDLVVITRQ